MVIFDDTINTCLPLKTVHFMSVLVHLNEKRRVQSVKTNIMSLTIHVNPKTATLIKISKYKQRYHQLFYCIGANLQSLCFLLASAYVTWWLLMLESVYLLTTPFVCLNHPFYQDDFLLLWYCPLFKKKKNQKKRPLSLWAFHLECFTSLKGVFPGFYRLNSWESQQVKIPVHRAASLLEEYRGTGGCILKKLYIGIGNGM